MYIYFDENDYVYGYGSEYEERSLKVDSIPEEVDKYLGCYKYINEEFFLDENRKNWIEQQWSAEKEINQLTQWFNWYDEQCIQYQRANRLGLGFDKDINELDSEAVSNATKIKQLRQILNTPYSEYEKSILESGGD